MKFAESRPYADPEKAARRIVEIASTVEPAQERRVDQWPVLVQGQEKPRRVRRGHGAHHRARPADDARERHLRALHTGRC